MPYRHFCCCCCYILLYHYHHHYHHHHHNHYYYYTHLTVFSMTACRVSRYQKGKPVWIKWDNRWWGITTPAPHHLIFYRPDALLEAQPTVSKHWRQDTEGDVSTGWLWRAAVADGSDIECGKLNGVGCQGCRQTDTARQLYLLAPLPSHPGQLSFLPLALRKISTTQSACSNAP